MSLILNIDTSSGLAFVSLTNDANIIGFMENAVQKEHAAFIHPALEQILQEAGKSFQEIDAIAVTAGPGSYTGIRVGMATAKGLCFAINKPFITLNTLEILACDAINNYPSEDNILFCPMIDARRMEVYTALYNIDGNEVLPPTAMIIDEKSLRKFSTSNGLVVFGNGSIKCKDQPAFQDAVFIENVNVSQAMAELAYKRYTRKAFADLMLSEPFYLKDFFDNKH